MADRMTSINLPGLRRLGAGYADYGRCEPEDMISLIREVAKRNLQEAQAILAAADEDFRIETYVGVWRRKQIEVLQEGKACE